MKKSHGSWSRETFFALGSVVLLFVDTLDIKCLNNKIGEKVGLSENVHNQRCLCKPYMNIANENRIMNQLR